MGWESTFKEGLVQALGSCIFIIFSSGDATRHTELTKEGKWVGANGGVSGSGSLFPFLTLNPTGWIKFWL